MARAVVKIEWIKENKAFLLGNQSGSSTVTDHNRNAFAFFSRQRKLY